MENTKPVITLADALYALIHHSNVPAKAQAEALGVSYSRLVNTALESAETFHHHTRWLIPQTKLTGNYVALDYIERSLGRIAFDLPKIRGGCTALATDLMRATRELGQMAGALETAIADGCMSREEAARCAQECDDVIRQAAVIASKMRELYEQEKTK